MALASGTKLGPYEIHSPLGAGGMGEVYRATQSSLGRQVAIKILSPAFAADQERLRRFEQEARAASALNHPNIISIYDVGRDGATSYIAMEFVDGKTLRSLIETGPLAIKKSLQIAVQIADGLAKAHAAGIVHRDLKPENIMVTRDGFVKILDFGLAKLMPSLDGSSAGSDQTLTKALPATHLRSARVIGRNRWRTHLWRRLGRSRSAAGRQDCQGAHAVRRAVAGFTPASGRARPHNFRLLAPAQQLEGNPN